MIRNSDKGYLVFTLDLSKIDTTQEYELFGGNNLLEITWEGGEEYSCTLY